MSDPQKRVKLNLTNSYDRPIKTPNPKWSAAPGTDSSFLFVRDAENAATSKTLIDDLTAGKRVRKSVEIEDTRPLKRDRKIFRDLLVKKLAKENSSGEIEIDVLRYYYYIQVSIQIQ